MSALYRGESILMFLSCPNLDEFELNPVIVGPRGSGLRVVDALVVAAKNRQ